MEIFGFEIKKKKTKEELISLDISQEIADSGVVVGNGENGWTAEAGVMDGIDYMTGVVPVEEVEQIKNYRALALNSEIDEALTEIRNEIFIFNDMSKRAFGLDFLEAPNAPSTALQKKISEACDELYEIIDFNKNGLTYFDQWYIDGRLYLQKIIDRNDPKKGIRKVRMLDCLNVRKVKFIPQDMNKVGIDLAKIQDWFLYSRKFDEKLQYGNLNLLNHGTDIGGLKIRGDYIAYANSGLRDLNTGRTIGYLNKAIIPFNNLKMMEDAMVIFRVVRAPQRRAIYVDVGQLQKAKSDSYMKDIMAKFKNKMTYDPATGALSDRRNIMSMMEDYWLPRREGSKGTEIQNLEGQDATGIVEEVEYYKDKLWRALGVPKSRFGEQPQGFIFGKGIEIQRDEYRFKKFLDKLRKYFMEIFSDMLKTHLILKKIIEEDEWEEIHSTMFWTYAEDNAFSEYKDTEIINNRIGTLESITPFVGKYFSVEWVRKNVLRQTETEIEEMDKAIDSENKKEGNQNEPEQPDGQTEKPNSGTPKTKAGGDEPPAD